MGMMEILSSKVGMEHPFAGMAEKAPRAGQSSLSVIRRNLHVPNSYVFNVIKASATKAEKEPFQVSFGQRPLN